MRTDGNYRTDTSVLGTLEDGTVEPETGYPFSRLRHFAANQFQINDNPDTTDLLAFFSAGGAGNDLTIHLQDATGVASFVVADVVFIGGGNFARFTVPAAFETVMARIANGDLFIIAFTRPTVISPLAATANASLEVDLSAAAPASLGDAPAHEPLAATANASFEVALAVAAPAALSSIDDTTASTTLYRFENIDLSADALEDVFTRFSGTLTTAGAWSSQATGVTATSNTGPGTNSSGPYVYSESSTSSGPAEILANSKLVMLESIMDTWTGAGRSITFRVCIQGTGWSGDDEGLRIITGTTEADSTQLVLLTGWDYSNNYVVGNTITNRQDDDYDIVQVGGWIDYTIDIPDGHEYFELGLICCCVRIVSPTRSGVVADRTGIDNHDDDAYAPGGNGKRFIRC